MKNLVGLLLAFLLLTAPALAQDIQAELSEMEAPLSGLLACLLAGKPYPQDAVDNDYALDYLFFMANIYYCDSVETPQESGPSDLRRARLEAEEIDLWLKWAFAGRFTLEDLQPDQVRLGTDEEDFWAAIGDGYALSVTLEGEGMEQVPFAYRLDSSDGTVRQGRLSASFVLSADPDAPLAVEGLAIDGVEENHLGNWRSEDGYWFSLMEEGLVFAFDGEDHLIGQGSYLLEDGMLAMELSGQKLSGQICNGEVTLSLAGLPRLFCRQTGA